MKFDDRRAFLINLLNFKNLKLMKKIGFIILAFAIVTSTQVFGQTSLPGDDGGPRESPEQRRCPDGKIKTVCVPHDYLGCGDIKGCS